jgi:predicted TIM-barrel fold metal-dependent hydrolase
MSDGAIDYLCGLFTPASIQANFLEGEERERLESVGRAEGLQGYEPADFIAHLDAIGVDKVLIPSILTWSYHGQHPVEHATVEEVVDAVSQYPDRLFGLYGVNCRLGMKGVAELESAVRDHGFRGIHIHPHGFGFPPNHQYYFPFYAKCQELGIPVVISMGHTLDFMPIENGRPLHMDDVALYFTELKIVIAHTGWPWVDEAIALATKHPNVYLGTSAYAPKYWQPQMVRFLDSRRGREKTMWGTDFPLVKHDEALRQIDELGIREESKRKLLTENAARVFGFA